MITWRTGKLNCWQEASEEPGSSGQKYFLRVLVPLKVLMLLGPRDTVVHAQAVEGQRTPQSTWGSSSSGAHQLHLF